MESIRPSEQGNPRPQAYEPFAEYKRSARQRDQPGRHDVTAVEGIDDSWKRLDFCENYGDLNDYLEEYEAGMMTAEAKAIYEALLQHGPLDTVRLRREAHMSAEGAKSRFERTLTELQVGLKVLPVGVAEAGAWNYAFKYEIVQRHLPELPEQARQIGRGEARRVLVARYLDDVVAAERKVIGQAFHVLKWTPGELERTIAALLEEGTVQEIEIEGVKGQQLVSGRALGRA